MPTIVVDGPPIPQIERKRELVKALYDAAHNVYGIKHITVVIRENPPENVGVNGELIMDRKRREQR
jgi:4-oxalocrotonate tautomerase